MTKKHNDNFFEEQIILKRVNDVLEDIFEISNRITVAISENDTEQLLKNIEYRRILIEEDLTQAIKNNGEDFSIENKEKFQEIEKVTKKNIDQLHFWKDEISVSLISLFNARRIVKYN